MRVQQGQMQQESDPAAWRVPGWVKHHVRRMRPANATTTTDDDDSGGWVNGGEDACWCSSYESGRRGKWRWRT